MTLPIDRRRVLAALGLLTLGSSISGCALVDPIVSQCPNDPRISDPNTPLTIDIHAHVFNASDLQVGAFLREVVADDLGELGQTVRDLSPVLETIAWTVAPDSNRENQALASVEQALATCVPQDQRILLAQSDAADAVASTLAARQHEAGVRELQRALREAQAGARFRATQRVPQDIVDTINGLPTDIRRYRIRKSLRSRRALRTAAREGAIDFILRMFQYRYVNITDYLNLFSQGTARKVDLIVAHLVDYDWPIARGAPTSTSLVQQIALMERISRLTGGRVHFFAPFDPFKQVAHDIGIESVSPFELVTQAVEQRGFVGVKLYPTMGFAPFGNSEIQVQDQDFWNRSDTVPTALKRPDLGQRLDAALARLYSWTMERGAFGGRRDVPIMAHTNISLGPNPAFESLAKARYWQKALEAFPGLRVNFGHFGATDQLAGSSPGRSERYADLMTAEPGSSGENTFADSAYFFEILNRRTELRARLQDLLAKTVGKGDASLSRRLMYGSDWEMLVMEGAVDGYLDRFAGLYKEFDGRTDLDPTGMVSSRFFGRNASTFLGLERNGANRRRLEQFYVANRVPRPSWMIKVDDLPRLTS